ncbi:MAG: hypothetical protein HYR56_25755 [Acidobacteria bacterium]|nr:hypothetical protein [Acidobacteriota bacterium]
MTNIITRHRRRLFALLCLGLAARLLFAHWEKLRAKTLPGHSGTAANPKAVSHAASPPVRTLNTATVAPAQSGGSYNLTQTVIPGGGGVSTNGSTKLEGSLGQSITALSSGGQYTLASGFQTSNCPAVTLTTAGLPNGTVNAVYNQALTVSGGVRHTTSRWARAACRMG